MTFPCKTRIFASLHLITGSTEEHLQGLVFNPDLYAVPDRSHWSDWLWCLSGVDEIELCQFTILLQIGRQRTDSLWSGIKMLQAQTHYSNETCQVLTEAFGCKPVHHNSNLFCSTSESLLLNMFFFRGAPGLGAACIMLSFQGWGLLWELHVYGGVSEKRHTKSCTLCPPSKAFSVFVVHCCAAQIQGVCLHVLPASTSFIISQSCLK